MKERIDQSREAARWSDAFNGFGRSDFNKLTKGEYDSRTQKIRNKIRNDVKKFRKDFARHFRVACFSADKDNILMWSHYAASHSGLCIGIRPANLRLAPENALRWKVTCDNKRLPIDHKKPNEVALRKAEAWEYEKEWRVVMATEELKSGRRPLEQRHKNDPPSEVACFLQLEWDAFESVRFGALVDRKKRAKIMELLQAKKRQHIRAIQMHLSIDRFALEEEVLQEGLVA